mgnify:CR=1 FL=1
MRNKDYRELQISSSMLVFVFIAVIILGIVIFLLGVSVGKKQAAITKETQFSAVPIEEVREEQPAAPEQDQINQEIASHIEDKDKKEEPIEKVETTAPKNQNLFYIQVGAYSDKTAALKIAERYSGMGIKSRVIDPFPTDRRTIYRVRIGGYETREEAEEVKKNLMEKENKKSSDYFIIKSSN